MEAQHFIASYESALASQDWNQVDPLISENASVIFSDGSIHQGKEAVKIAFERNFSIIKSEKYQIKNVNWLKIDEHFAVFNFEFEWAGLINGDLVSGEGVGSSVIVKEEDSWMILSEHLGRKS